MTGNFIKFILLYTDILMPRNKSNNVLVKFILPLAKLLRDKDPSLSQRQAVKQASAIYREHKGTGIFDDIIARNKHDLLPGLKKVLSDFAGNL